MVNMEYNKQRVNLVKGKTYECENVVRHDEVLTFTVLKVSAQSVKAVCNNTGEERRCKIRFSIEYNCEYFVFGSYPGAPVMYASAEYKQPVKRLVKKHIENDVKPEITEPTTTNGKLYFNPIFIKESGCYLYYEFLGVQFKVAKHSSPFALYARCMQIERDFEQSVNAIANAI